MRLSPCMCGSERKSCFMPQTCFAACGSIFIKGVNAMRIQVSTDYAIRILQYLHENKGGLHTATYIAEDIGITYPFFIKIANTLKKKGFLHSVRGRNGGYRLSRSAHEISVYDVFLAIEGKLQINSCLNGANDPCTSGSEERCKFRSFLSHLQDNLIIAPMSEMRVSDLVHAGEDKVKHERPQYREASDEDLLRLRRHFLPITGGAVVSSIARL